MTKLRRTLHAILFVAVGLLGFFAPDAAAYVNSLTAPVPPVVVPVKRPPITDAAAVRIELEKGLGSGVHIGNGFILTAAHVVGDAKTAKIKTRFGDEGKADVLWANAEFDIALMRTATAFPAAEIDCNEARVGSAITAIGNPLGMEFIAAYGKIAGSPRPLAPNWKTVFVTDITTIMGHSGGPVFSDEGKVVGITVGVSGAPMEGGGRSYIGYGFVVPSSAVCHLLGRAI